MIGKKRVFYKEDERMYKKCIEEQKEVHATVKDNLTKMAFTLIKDSKFALDLKKLSSYISELQSIGSTDIETIGSKSEVMSLDRAK
jgi:hypothetical protein